ncbi:sugar transferase [Lactococcus lactis]|uniref:sugar transferase n=1 Tax=Lactococcus lactis TaxID=1358 RepID=UPI0016521CF0|nr:sugar transferase [Lactococcus lactis]QNL92999.1 sugar transferase [Lactococcus lactis]
MKYMKIKRFFDICFSMILIIILIPLWIVIIVVMKIEDFNGPIVYKQERIGLAGSKFIMYKFRSMVVDADSLKCELEQVNEQSGPIFKIKKDPRITKVGSILRKTSLDEFPQLLNIIRGEMSLIGPRPALPSEVEKYSDYQKKRLSVKPGCTGLWQVSGRSNLNFDQMLQLDLEYIENYGALTDIKIFFKTFKIILTREGAY